MVYVGELFRFSCHGWNNRLWRHTVEELSVLFRGHAHSSRQLREKLGLKELPSMVRWILLPHRTRIQQWLDKTKNQMTGFPRERERQLIQKVQENRQNVPRVHCTGE